MSFSQRSQGLSHDLLQQVIAITAKVDGLSQGSPNIHFGGACRKRSRSLYASTQRALFSDEVSYATLQRILIDVARASERMRLFLENELGPAVGGRLSIGRVDVVLLIQDVVDLFADLADRKGIRVEIEAPDELFVHADFSLLFRAIANLFDNAVKYSYHTSDQSSPRFIALNVRRHSTAGSCFASFSSYGVGIEQEEIVSGAIFEHGFRGKHALQESRSGSGCGLAETKRILELHGGSVSAHSIDEGDGVYLTTFEVTLPSRVGGVR